MFVKKLEIGRKHNNVLDNTPNSRRKQLISLCKSSLTHSWKNEQWCVIFFKLAVLTFCFCAGKACLKYLCQLAVALIQELVLSSLQYDLFFQQNIFVIFLVKLITRFCAVFLLKFWLCYFIYGLNIKLPYHEHPRL